MEERGEFLGLFVRHRADTRPVDDQWPEVQERGSDFGIGYAFSASHE